VLVTGGIEKTETLNADQIMQQLDMPTPSEVADPAASMDAAPKEGEVPNPANDASKEDDPMKALMEAEARDAKKKP
jgi:hypothetical protein